MNCHAALPWYAIPWCAQRLPALLWATAGWLPVAALAPCFVLPRTPWLVRLSLAAALGVFSAQTLPSAGEELTELAWPAALALQALRGCIAAALLALPVLALALLGEYADAWQVPRLPDAAGARGVWLSLCVAIAVAAFCMAGGLRAAVAFAAEAMHPLAADATPAVLDRPALWTIVRRYGELLRWSLSLAAPLLAALLLFDAAAGVVARLTGMATLALAPLRSLLTLATMLLALPWVLEALLGFATRSPGRP